MENKEYIAQAILTENQDFDSIIKRLDSIEVIRLLHGAIGIATEAGELLDALKKHIFYGAPLDKTNIKEECGDVFWYQGLICNELATEFESLMRRNIEKLRARYPNKFTEYDAQHRDLKTEREILER